MTSAAARAQSPASSAAEPGATPPQTAAPDSSAPDQTAQPANNRWLLQAQSTFVDQGTARFHSPFEGPNSLNPGTRGRETVDVTFYGGFRPWAGGEIWIDPELDQGFGLSDTLGAAGFPSAEAYKVGAQRPYVRLQRFFFRQTVGLGGGTESVDLDQNVVAGTRDVDRLVLTVGKFGVTDVFDTNKYAHDPRGDVLNWSLDDTGSFDYAADAWGYSQGMAAEWYHGPWTLRGGLFDLSDVPNSETLETDFSQFQLDGEVERRYRAFGHDVKIKATVFLNRARMGDYADAVRLGEFTGATPSTALVRRYHGRAGVSFDLEQPVADDLGVFARGGWADGHQETYEFTDIDRTFSAGFALSGRRWRRPDDTVMLAGVVNDISKDFKAYLAAGGLGILIGDGRLPHPGAEQIVETSYNFAATKFAHITLDYQFLDNPGYDRDRGPVSVLAIRLHLQSNSLLP